MIPTIRKYIIAYFSLVDNEEIQTIDVHNENKILYQIEHDTFFSVKKNHFD
jgi:hypothetical protein